MQYSLFCSCVNALTSLEILPELRFKRQMFAKACATPSAATLRQPKGTNESG